MICTAVISQQRILQLHLSQQHRYLLESVVQHGIILRCQTAQNGTHLIANILIIKKFLSQTLCRLVIRDTDLSVCLYNEPFTKIRVKIYKVVIISVRIIYFLIHQFPWLCVSRGETHLLTVIQIFIIHKKA
jgi:hypothetical protein